MILILLGLFNTDAHAAHIAFYHQAPPAHLCVAATELDNQVGSCEENGMYLQYTKQCWEKVKDIHNQVTAEYKKTIAANKTTNQNQDFATSEADQKEAVAAHDYMLKVTENAYDDLDKYFDYVVLPDDLPYLSDDQVLNIPCYRDAVMPMDDIMADMEDKIDEMKASKGMEQAMGATSGTRKTNTNSISGPQASGGKAQGTGKVKAGTSKNGASSITGVDEDKKKQQQK